MIRVFSEVERGAARRVATWLPTSDVFPMQRRLFKVHHVVVWLPPPVALSFFNIKCFLSPVRPCYLSGF